MKIVFSRPKGSYFLKQWTVLGKSFEQRLPESSVENAISTGEEYDDFSLKN